MKKLILAVTLTTLKPYKNLLRSYCLNLLNSVAKNSEGVQFDEETIPPFQGLINNYNQLDHDAQVTVFVCFLNVLVTELQGVTCGHSSSDSSLMKDQQQSVNFQQQPTGESDQVGLIMQARSLSTIGGENTKATVRRLFLYMIKNPLGWKRGKIAFSSLQFKEVLKEIVRKNRLCPNATDAEIYSVAKNWFRFASDREGGRKRRAEKKRLSAAQNDTEQEGNGADETGRKSECSEIQTRRTLYRGNPETSQDTSWMKSIKTRTLHIIAAWEHNKEEFDAKPCVLVDNQHREEKPWLDEQYREILPTDQSRQQTGRYLVVVLLPSCRCINIHNTGKALARTDQSFGFELGRDKSYKDEINRRMTDRLVNAVIASEGGMEKSSWPLREIEGACKTYYISLRDTERRKLSGKEKEHTQRSRRQSRRRERAARLKKTLKSVGDDKLGDFDKEKVMKVFKGDYMSSEESEEDDAREFSHFSVRRLP
uniref:Uncharacterized protein n=2 Tax=Magallana TaxID=2171616 RepID=A0A8W8MDM5_MAGGI